MSVKSDNENGVENGSDHLEDSDVQEEVRIDENAPRARLCHLKKWPNFQGYGFNLHAERAKQGHHIGKVDADSPAESAGLREGDRIIEVNNVNISNENHQQVVRRIRNGYEDPAEGVVHEDEVILLVVDSEADQYYKRLNIIVRNDFEYVLKKKTGPPPAHLSEAAKAAVPVIAASSSAVTQQNGAPVAAKPSTSVDRNNNTSNETAKKTTTTTTPANDTISNTSMNSKASSSNQNGANGGSINRRNSSETPLDRTNSNSSKSSSTNGTPAIAPANARINQSTSSSASSASSTVSSDRNQNINAKVSPQAKTNGSSVNKNGGINHENSLNNSDRIDPFHDSEQDADVEQEEDDDERYFSTHSRRTNNASSVSEGVAKAKSAGAEALRAGTTSTPKKKLSAKDVISPFMTSSRQREGAAAADERNATDERDEFSCCSSQVDTEIREKAYKAFNHVVDAVVNNTKLRKSRNSASSAVVTNRVSKLTSSEDSIGQMFSHSSKIETLMKAARNESSFESRLRDKKSDNRLSRNLDTTSINSRDSTKLKPPRPPPPKCSASYFGNDSNRSSITSKQSASYRHDWSHPSSRNPPSTLQHTKASVELPSSGYSKRQSVQSSTNSIRMQSTTANSMSPFGDDSRAIDPDARSSRGSSKAAFRNLDYSLFFNQPTKCISPNTNSLSYSYKPPLNPVRNYPLNMSESSSRPKHTLPKNDFLYEPEPYKTPLSVIDKYLEMSAAEFKNYLKNKGRTDPRITPVDMKQKFKIFQDM